MPTLPEPVWEPDPAMLQKAFDDPSALANLRFKPSVITGVLLRVLQAHFWDPANIVDPDLRRIIWADDDPSIGDIQSRLLIQPLYQYDARTIGQRPAILVTRGEAEVRRWPLQGRATLTTDKNGFFRGERYFAPIVGSHVLRCVAKGAFAADRLGEEVFYRMLEYVPAIKRDFPFGDLQIRMIAAPRKIEEAEAGENFMTDVSVPWIHIHSWTLTEQAPILKKIRLTNGQPFGA